jgi:hypothetical protein
MEPHYLWCNLGEIEAHTRGCKNFALAAQVRYTIALLWHKNGSKTKLSPVLRIRDVLSRILDPDPNIYSFWIPDPNSFHPGSYIKRGMKRKNYLFSCFLWFQVEVFKVKLISDPDPGGKKAPDPGSHLQC